MAATSGRLEAAAQFFERPLDEAHVQVALVAEVDGEQGAAEPGLARHEVHGDGVPAALRIDGLRRIEDLGPAAVAFFLASLGDVGHGGMLHCN